MALETFPYKDIIHRCFRCGYCKFPVNWTDVNNCPPYARFRMESYSCGGRLWLTRAWLNGELNWSEHLAEILYSCTTCKNCEIMCPLRFNIDIVNMVIAARNEMVERGTLPRSVKTFLENIALYGNPYGIRRSLRGAWAEQDGIETYNGHEYLLYAGCAGSYDDRAQEALKTLAKILRETGLSFGILGQEECCDGNEVKSLGEMGLFHELAEMNISLFKKYNIKKIITFSPHAYNAFKNYYLPYGGDFSVFHYTHILYRLIVEGRVRFTQALKKTVTFHDPCFLGRWNNEYEIPRKIIKAIPGLKFVEMRKNREGSLCCGGGSGNFSIDLLAGKDSPARKRVKEAYEAGAELLITACPKCLIMLNNAVKEEDLEGHMAVKDLSEIVLDACKK